MSNIDEIIAIPFRMLEVLSSGYKGGVTPSKPRSGTTSTYTGVTAKAGVTSAARHVSSTPVHHQTAQQRQVRVLPSTPPSTQKPPSRGGKGRFV